MRSIVLMGVLALVFGACGGPKIPAHSGYKNDKLKPWKKAKTIKLDDKGEGKSDGDLNYATFERAKWYGIEVPSHGNLTIKLEITPPGDQVNEDFDLAMEVLDPGFRIIGKSDLEDEDAGELAKTKLLVELDPGRYLVHLYLQGRMDSADFTIKVAFQSTKKADDKSDFPAQVAFVPELAKVNDVDETPKRKQPPPPPTTGPRPPRPPRPPPTTTPDKPPPTILSARIIGINVSGAKTQITIGRGISTGAQSGMKATLKGIGGQWPIACTDTTCSATVEASPDKVRASGGSVTLVP